MIEESLEEAGALLGTSITKLQNTTTTTTTTTASKLTTPPQGMHSSFSTSTIPSSELFFRLTNLRTLLQKTNSTSNPNPLLPSAPSLLAVLMKILLVSSAPTRSSSAPEMETGKTSPGALKGSSISNRPAKPPLLSNALRRTWVECVVLCYRLGCNLAGSARVDVYAFLKRMMDLAGANPKSAKAAGGSRLAALESIAGLYLDTIILPKISSWAGEILSLCHRGLRSSGSGEPSYRAICVSTACCVVQGCRSYTSHKKTSSLFVHRNVLEDKAILEAVKLVKRASDDKFPEVRGRAGKLACLLGPVVVQEGRGEERGDGSGSGSEKGLVLPLANLEEVLQVSLRCLDDESAYVSEKWAEALARCICTSIDYGQQVREAEASNKNAKRNQDDPDEEKTETHTSTGTTPHDILQKFKTYTESRRSGSVTFTCSSFPSALEYLVESFVKMGGEFSSSKCGSTYSAGGRAPRVGMTLAIVHLLRLQSACGNIGQVGVLLTKETIDVVMNMVGPMLEKQLSSSEKGDDRSGSSSSLGSDPSSYSILNRSVFGKKSVADAGLARLATGRVLRCGLGELASEGMQLCLIRDLASFCAKAARENDDGPNQHQLQVALVEISHLISALGEAASSTLDHLLPTLRFCLSHYDHGVRFEACNVFSSTASSIPRVGITFLLQSLAEVNTHKSLIAELANQPPQTTPPPTAKRRFRRSSPLPANTESNDKLTTLQNSLHGNVLAVCMLLHQISRTEGIPTKVLDDIVSTAKTLITSMYDETYLKRYPHSACACARCGYFLLSAVLAIGPSGIKPHIPLLFQLWQRSACFSSPYVSRSHEVIYLEAFLSSVIHFLRSCPDLLLSIPDALNRTTLLLEKLFGILAVGGRLGGVKGMESAKAILMEAFTWLPPGSFPIAADVLFDFAAEEIKIGTNAEVCTSLLPSLVTNEDKLLDATSLYRSISISQSSCSSLTSTLLSLTLDPVDPSERELTLHTTSPRPPSSSLDSTPLSSPILAITNSHDHPTPPPTPLHDVGTWREPPAPCTAVKTRLLDGAILAFAATFGLQDGQHQERVMMALERLLPATINTRFGSVGAALMSSSRNEERLGQESAASSNIVATLLACVRSLPFHESSPDMQSRMGPPWMSKAKNLFFALLPSPSALIRRGAAEGLASLAQIGISEDAHTLQSSILHSLDEVMRGNHFDGTPKKTHSDVSLSRSSSLFALACLQRANHKLRETTRSYRMRRAGRPAEDPSSPSNSSPPTMIMMTRVLSSTILNDSSLVRAFALHSFGLLMSYSIPEGKKITEEGKQVIFKAVESVEREFFHWSAVSHLDRDQKSEKFSTEQILLSVMIRLMSYLLPRLNYIQEQDDLVVVRFCRIWMCLLEACQGHPTVVLEGLAFLERLSVYKKLLHPKVQRELEGFFGKSLPFVLGILNPSKVDLLAEAGESYVESSYCLRGAVICLRKILGSVVGTDRKLRVALFSLLEMEFDRAYYVGAADFSQVETSRDAERYAFQREMVKGEVVEVIEQFLRLETDDDLHWVLFARALISSGAEEKRALGEEGELTFAEVARRVNRAAYMEAMEVSARANSSRWQVKKEATRIAHLALSDIVQKCQGKTSPPHFDPMDARALCAKQCREINALQDNNPSSTPLPKSYVALHLEDLITTACSITNVTLDHAELPSLQNNGLLLLTLLIRQFGHALDPDFTPHGTETHSPVLQQFSSQIVSTIKHALSGGGDADDAAAKGNHHLFLSGCEAMRLLVKKGLVTDPIVLRRMIRPLVELNSGLKAGGYPTRKSDVEELLLRPKLTSLGENIQSILLHRVGSVAALADLRISADMGVLQGEIAEVLVEEMKKIEKVLAIHSAVLVMDAVRIVRGRGLTLCGEKEKSDNDDGDEEEEETKEKDSSTTAGFTFANVNDIGETVSTALIQMWPILTAYSVSFLNLENDETSEMMTGWLKKITPVIFMGLHDALALVGTNAKRKLSQQMSPEEIATICIHGVRKLVSGGVRLGDTSVTESVSNELGDVMQSLLCKVLVPSLGLTMDWCDGGNGSTQENEEKESNVNSSGELISQCCGLMEDLCLAREKFNVCFGGTALTRAVLIPLTAFQEGVLSIKNDDASGDILASCLRSAKFLLVERDETENGHTLLKAMLHLSLSIFIVTNSEQDLPSNVKDAASGLFQECLNSPALDVSETRKLAKEAARIGSWEAWGMVCTGLKDGSGVVSSLDSIRDALGDTENHQSHRAALSAIRTALQDGSTTPEEATNTVECLMQGVGPQVLQLLKLHGLSSSGQCPDRLTVCADAMRILMLSLQHLMVTTSDEEAAAAAAKLASFLKILFGVFVPLIDFNGLPNHPKRNVGSDPALGRMCAQAAVHVAKRSPAAFKASMINLTGEDRSVLEMAARAEMSGYAAPKAAAPSKKKLNLKRFQ